MLKKVIFLLIILCALVSPVSAFWKESFEGREDDLSQSHFTGLNLVTYGHGYAHYKSSIAGSSYFSRIPR
jgi:hypothetical protein